MTSEDDAQTKRTERMRNFSLARVVFWLAMTPIFWLTGLWDRVWLVSLLSIWALVETPFAAWRADDNPDAKRMVRLEDKVDELLMAQARLLELQPKPATRSRTRTRSTS